jgi:hypothetical protein
VPVGLTFFSCANSAHDSPLAGCKCEHAFISKALDTPFCAALILLLQWYGLQQTLCILGCTTDFGCCSEMSHDGFDGRCSDLAWGSSCYENVAMNMESDMMSGCKKAMEQWWESPGHKANMIADDATLNGVGYHECGNGEKMYTQILGGK